MKEEEENDLGKVLDTEYDLFSDGQFEPAAQTEPDDDPVFFPDKDLDNDPFLALDRDFAARLLRTIIIAVFIVFS